MSDKNKKIIICAGGTGGHVFPAKKLSEMLLKETVEISWIGSSRGPEEQICKDLGIKFYRYPLTGFRGKSLFFKILSLIFLIFSFLRFFLEFQIGNVFSKRNILVCFVGYVSLVGLAHFSGPIYIQEQNSIPGSTNRLLARYKKIDKIFCGFPKTQDFFEEKKAIFSGNLINLDAQKVEKKKPCSGELDIKIMGGSLGARLINKTAPKVFSQLSQDFPDFKFILSHQCGKGNLEETKSYYDSCKKNFDLKLFEFVESMESFYSNADLIISRAGALSVSEICETQNIAIFIPLKNSIDNHQHENAKFLAEKNSAFICEEDLLEENLKKILFEIVKNPEILEKMKKNISRISLTDKKNIIVKKILSNE